MKFTEYVLSWVVGIGILALVAWPLEALGLGVWPSVFIVFAVALVVVGVAKQMSGRGPTRAELLKQREELLARVARRELVERAQAEEAAEQAAQAEREYFESEAARRASYNRGTPWEQR